MSDYYNRSGAPISRDEWIALYTDENKRVAHDTIGNVNVSTVWLGLNHAWGGGAPLIFETMVFGGVLDGDCERYGSEAEALAGHAAMVTRVREALS